MQEKSLNDLLDVSLYDDSNIDNLNPIGDNLNNDIISNDTSIGSHKIVLDDNFSIDKSINVCNENKTNLSISEETIDLEKYGNNQTHSIIHYKQKESGHQTDLMNTDFMSSCIACQNYDFPTGLHTCLCCNKNNHLFGCSVPAPNIQEGCGEKRICLSCDKEISMDQEFKAVEIWNKKKSSTKNTRSTSSYLSKQPGFEHIGFNKKGIIKPITFLKNGNVLRIRPSNIRGVGKV